MAAAGCVSHFYAELLVNIRSIGVSIWCKDGTDATTVRASLSDDRTHISITPATGATCSTFALPGTISAQHGSSIHLSSSSSGHLTCRLPLDFDVWSSRNLEDESVTPWSAIAPQKFECAHCRVCRSNVILPNAVRDWRDLPSENWAEMMDFWHCHKPDEPKSKDQNEQVASKGYAAGHRLTARPGLGFIDPCHFVVSKEDCSTSTILVTPDSSTEPSLLSCVRCDAALGVEDLQTSGLKLFKWSLAVGIAAHTQLDLYPIEKWLTARIISLSEAINVKKVFISGPAASASLPLASSHTLSGSPHMLLEPSHTPSPSSHTLSTVDATTAGHTSVSKSSTPNTLPVSTSCNSTSSRQRSGHDTTSNPSSNTSHIASKDSATGFVLWLLTPDFWLSGQLVQSSDAPRHWTSSGKTRATKMLFKRETISFDGLPESVGQLQLSGDMFQLLERSLHENQAVLPSDARKHGDWEISFLKRFLPEEISGRH